jgi:hypothetical protein
MLMVRDETARILDGLTLADAIPEDAFAELALAADEA